MKKFAEMKFYTTAEIAQKLGMNIQVIARKLQSGEISGYKIGKDWRVEEEAIQKWLGKVSNPVRLSPKQKVIKNFIRNGHIIRLPAQRKKRVLLLEHLLESFEPYKIYTESEINDIIRKYYDDYCTVRRELVDEKMMIRNAGKYKRNSTYRLIG